MSTATTGSAAFGGRIGRTLADSEPWFEEPPHPGEAAPNVVVVLLDDTGFAQLRLLRLRRSTPRTSTRSPPAACSSPTSTSRRCARRRGRRCSPAATSTPSACARWPTSAPGSRTSARPHLRTHAATVAEVLRDEGYATFVRRQVAPRADGGVLGGRPVRPVAAAARVRPVLRLPRGRDRPVPSRPGVRQPPDRSAAAGPRTATTSARTSSTSAADDRPTARGRAARPPVLRLPRRSARRTRRTRRRPSTWQKYRGAFDEGWDVVRERWFERQLGARRRSPRAPSWRRATPASSRGTRCPRTQQRLACRLQEAFAAFLDHTDAQIGRLVDGLRRTRPARQHAADRAGRQRRVARRAARSACCTR